MVILYMYCIVYMAGAGAGAGAEIMEKMEPGLKINKFGSATL